MRSAGPESKMKEENSTKLHPKLVPTALVGVQDHQKAM
jgi:hypothetical protein